MLASPWPNVVNSQNTQILYDVGPTLGQRKQSDCRFTGGVTVQASPSWIHAASMLFREYVLLNQGELVNEYF